MRPFAFLEPQTLEEACAMLACEGEEARLIAGGQSLVPLLWQRVIGPKAVINLKGLRDLEYVRDGDGSLKIGALTTHRAVETSGAVKSRLAALSDAERRLGNVQVRNWGTIGGNLCHADPAGDLAPVLLAAGARVKVVSQRGTRSIDLADFFVDLYTTALAADEILSEIEVPHLPGGGAMAYRKESVIAGGSPIASVAVFAALDETRRRVREARIVLGGVGSTPVRASRAEQALVGQEVERIHGVGEVAAGEAHPAASVDGSPEYKREIVSVLTDEIVTLAVERALWK